MDNRTCCKCKESKPLEDFAKDKSKKSGHRYKCKQCSRRPKKDKPARVVVIITDKICSKCKIDKPVEDFHKSKLILCGYESQCKQCRKLQEAKFRLKEKQIPTEGVKKCGRCKDIFDVKKFVKDKSRGDGLSTVCKKCDKEMNDIYRANNVEKISLYNRRPEKKDQNKKAIAKMLEKDPDHFKKYNRKRYATNPQYKLSLRCRGQIIDALRGKAAKSKRSFELIGCTVSELKVHLESQFLPTMEWSNHGTTWHIDHIKPVASFDLTEQDQQKLCFHYSNLQPLFTTTRVIDGIEYVGNLNKGDMILDTFKRQVA